jgi:hypothetical protein
MQLMGPAPAYQEKQATLLAELQQWLSCLPRHWNLRLDNISPELVAAFMCGAWLPQHAPASRVGALPAASSMRTAQGTLAAALGRVNQAFRPAAAGSQQYVLQDALAGYARTVKAAEQPDTVAARQFDSDQMQQLAAALQQQIAAAVTQQDWRTALLLLRRLSGR